MDKQERKTAIAAYKERKVTAGIYALRCLPTGRCWVGSAPDLDTIANRLRFTLKQGGNPHRSLQEAWRDHGQEAFSFDVLEELEDEEEMPYGRDRELKNRHEFWLAKLDATRI